MLQRSQFAETSTLRIAAVVVTFDRLAQLQQTVPRLLAEAIDHLVVIDNGSGDGTAEWLAGVDDLRLLVLTSVDNSGGAGGFEVGMREATARFDPDWLIVMDDDARPMPGVVARFRAMDPVGWDVVAGGVYYPDGRICDMNRPSVNPFWHLGAFLRTLIGGGRMGFHVPDEAYLAHTPAPIDAASFVGLFVSRASIQRGGYPDGRLFLYGDDVLYTLGLRRAGCTIGFIPELRFEHDFSTFTEGSTVFKPLWKAFYHHRNLLFVYRSASGIFFGLVLLLILPKWLMKGAAYGADRPAFMRLVKLAIRDGLRGQRSRSHADVLAVMERP